MKNINFEKNILKIKEIKIPIFIISLRNDKDRRKKLLKFLPSKIVNNYFKAVDMRFANRKKLDKFCNNRRIKKIYKRKLFPGEVGIALSHQKIYKYIVKKKIPFALVFEDDVKIEERNWKFKLYEILKELSNLNFEKKIVCNLGLDNNKIKKKKILILEWFPKFLKKIHILNLNNSKQKLAHSYFISFSAAKNILKSNIKINCVADDWGIFNKQKCFDYYVISQKLFDQNKLFKSQIQLYKKDISNEKLLNNKNIYFVIKNILKLVLGFIYQWLCFKIIFKNEF